MPDSSILRGIEPIINRALELQGGENYSDMSTCLSLSREPPKNFCAETLIDSMFRSIKNNWPRTRLGSKKNWLSERPQKLSSDIKKREVSLERLITSIKWPDSDKWVYQVPTASGLTSSTKDKKRAIDLVHWTEPEKKWFEFIELKVGKSGGTPLFAAIEILQYGILYIFSRNYMKELGYEVSQQPTLNAAGIHLRVLAPVDYYDLKRVHLGWLEDKIDEGLRIYLDAKDFRMDFEFQKFPENFKLSAILEDHETRDSKIRQAMSSRTRVYPRHR